MMKLFRIRPSRSQFQIISLAYFLIAASGIAYVPDLWIGCLIALLSMLLWITEFRIRASREKLWMRLDLNRHSIRIEDCEQSYFYLKYKVYPARWFVILVLIGTSKNRTLVLNSDRFSSVKKYNQMRYCLAHMRSESNVA